MKAREVMTASPVCCTPDTKVEEAAQMMAVHRCGCIPVVNHLVNRKVVGIVTDRDIVCRAIAAHKNPVQVTVGECMTTPVATVSPEATVEECCRTMVASHVHRLPVTNGMGQCEGIISETDLLPYVPRSVAGELARRVCHYARPTMYGS